MDFSEHSRVWVYQSDRELSTDEATQIQILLDNFTKSWTAHNRDLKAGAEIRYNRFLILIVDESQAGASGCAIDKSVNFMKQLEGQFGINVFDRFNLAYRTGDDITAVNRNSFEELLRDGSIRLDTIVFNNLVKNVRELQTNWEVPFKESWHMQLFKDLVAI